MASRIAPGAVLMLFLFNLVCVHFSVQGNNSQM
mgnify:CR=1 FL=1